MAVNINTQIPTKVVNVRVDARLHNLMKQKCVAELKTIPQFIEEAIANQLNVMQNEEGEWIDRTNR